MSFPLPIKLILLAVITTLLISSRPAGAGTIRNHTVWKDTDNKPIDCHEGGILRVGDTFYWYGRVYAGNPDGTYGAAGAKFRGGICCYCSKDLVNWKNLGVVLPYPASGWVSQGTWHRPRVLFNATTKKYVLWFVCLESVYPAQAAVAISDSPAGPFTILDKPVANVRTGDLTIFQDDDGKGYFCHDGGPQGRRAFVARLTADFLGIDGGEVMAMPATTDHEGESMARYQGKYIVAASGISPVHRGVGPSDTYYAVADSPLGPYDYKGLMSEPGNSTWNSQIGSFLYIKESDTLMALCDQWFVGPGGEEVTCDQSCQFWVPVTFDPATGAAKLQNLKAWDPMEKTRK
jgi:hypothetical protein